MVETKKFSEIRAELTAKQNLSDTPLLRPWMSSIPDDVDVEVDEHTQGNVVRHDAYASKDREQEGRHVSIILDGFAEIFEDHMLHATESATYGIRACRPVRLIEAGDIIGDFSFIDRKIFGDERFLTTLSRPREIWNISWGVRSGYFIPNMPKDITLPNIKQTNMNARSYFISPAVSGKGSGWLSQNLEQHLDCFGIHIITGNSEFRTRIAKVDLSKLEDSKAREVADSIIQDTSWKRAYTYRSSENSYNISERFKFEYGSHIAIHEYVQRSLNNKKINKRLTEQKKILINNTITIHKFIDIFISAIYDAINRPLREEPVFGFEISGGPLCKYFDSNLEKFGKFLLPMRISKRRNEIKEFYFPIGATNFLVANYAVAFDLKDDLFHSFNAINAKKNEWEFTDSLERQLEDGKNISFPLDFSENSNNVTETRFSIVWQMLGQKIIDFHKDPGAYLRNVDLTDYYGTEEIKPRSVNGATLKEKLLALVDGKKTFHMFSDVLIDYPYNLSVVRMPNLADGFDVFVKYTLKD